MAAGGARAVAGPGGGAPGPSPGDERERRLARLGVDVGRLRARLGAAQAEVHALEAAQATRRLRAAEARRVTTLRLESGALRLELAALWEEFERLRAGRTPTR